MHSVSHKCYRTGFLRTDFWESMHSVSQKVLPNWLFFWELTLELSGENWLLGICFSKVATELASENWLSVSQTSLPNWLFWELTLELTGEDWLLGISTFCFSKVATEPTFETWLLRTHFWVTFANLFEWLLRISTSCSELPFENRRLRTVFWELTFENSLSKTDLWQSLHSVASWAHSAASWLLRISLAGGPRRLMTFLRTDFRSDFSEVAFENLYILFLTSRYRTDFWELIFEKCLLRISTFCSGLPFENSTDVSEQTFENWLLWELTSENWLLRADFWESILQEEARRLMTEILEAKDARAKRLVCVVSYN